MRFRVSVGAALTVCALAAVFVSAALVPPALAAATTPHVLYAGHQLVAKTSEDRLSSPSSEFQLQLSPDSVELDQFAPLSGPKGPDGTGTGLWFRDDPTGKHQSNTDHTVLRLEPSGNLVLRTSRGYVLWTSHTKGTGRHNRVVVKDNGDLVMYTAANRKVWSSRTTGVLLPAGRELGSGQRLRDEWNDQLGGSIDQLIMQRSGDLQYRCGSHILWRTNTEVRGSIAVLRKNGDFEVLSPSNKALWSTHTAGGGPYTWLDAPRLTLYNTHFHQLWHPRRDMVCGSS
jgi:hypothetical protein